MTGTGIVALAGIVVNNAIVLIDTFNRFREDGLASIEAALKTSAQRIRPVMLTTTTTIAGLIPMATQLNLDFVNQVVTMGSITAVWWVQLSTAIIFGLGFATILTLIVIPTMLTLPSVWSNVFFGRRTQSGTRDEAEAPQEPGDDNGSAGAQTLVTTTVTPFGPRRSVTASPTTDKPDGLPHAAE
jgi:multidrug efflux pump